MLVLTDRPRDRSSVVPILGSRNAEWSGPLTIPVEHTHIVPTVDVKWTEYSLVFYGHVAQQERDIIYVRDDIVAVATLAGIVQWGGSPSAECREQLSRF